MSDLSEYYLATSAAVAALDLFEISHPDFTQTYRIVRNARDGVTVDLSPSELARDFIFYPARVTTMGVSDDSEATIKIELGDVGEVLATEMDALAEVGGFLTKPAMRYWMFRSDALDAPIQGPIELEISDIDFSTDGAAFEASAKRLAETRTGEIYDLDRFMMLRGFL